MKVTLTTLNSKFIHSSLALRYIEKYCRSYIDNVYIKEYTINNHLDYILADLYKEKSDVICFSCYIWNLNEILKLAKDLKKVNPNVVIVLGGPEVSYDAKELLNKNTFVDYIVSGEGEIALKELLVALRDDRPTSNISGVTARVEKEIVSNHPCMIENLDDIPFPYDDFTELDNRIIYYESSRGCPFNCQYCISSTFKGVRYFSLERVKRDLKIFVDANVRQVKFIDRTFNAKKELSLEIMKYLADIDNGSINFHFEITAALVDEETLTFLETIRPGLFQFEIGIQSTNPKTRVEIQRNMKLDKIKEIVHRMVNNRNIHIHLDLIAGLPYEDYCTFLKSFDDVYSMKANKLQLGFLKLLKGSGLRDNREKYGYVFDDKAPYEVFSNDYISFEDMLKLKDIEDMVDHFYNSHRTESSIGYLLKKYYDRPSTLFVELAEFWNTKQMQHTSHAKDKDYEFLLDFYIYKGYDNVLLFKELLKYDYVSVFSGKLPKLFNIELDKEYRNKCHEFLKDEDNIDMYLKGYKGIPAKKIINKVGFHKFIFNIVEFLADEVYDSDKLVEGDYTILFDYNTPNKDVVSSFKHVVKLGE